MSPGENACIRYLMKEMDPSEELVFENEMLEDENLLIEVESLRAVSRRLNELPVMEPPESVTSDILMDISLNVKEKENRRQVKYTVLTAAATILIVVLGGSWMMISDEFNGNEADASTAGTSLPDFGYVGVENTSSTSVTPWIDNNQVLEFNSREETVSAASFDSIMRSSYQKLEPLEQANGSGGRLRLTGSQ